MKKRKKHTLRIAEDNNQQNPSRVNSSDQIGSTKESVSIQKSSEINPDAKYEQEWRNENNNFLKKQLSLAWWLNVITFIAASAAAIGLVYLNTQANVAKTTAQIALDQFHISQRPWVGIVEPILIDKPLTFDSKGVEIAIRVKVKNFGASPANAAFPLFDMMLTENLDDVSKRQSQVCSWPAAKARIGHLIFPNQETTTVQMNIRKERNDIVINSKGLTEAWLVGCMPYWDQFNQFRSTDLYYMFNFLSGNAEFKPTGVVQGSFYPYFFGNRAK